MIEQSVGAVMTPSVRTITPDTTACTVAKLFADNNIGSAVVVDPETETVLGIVTESDIMRQVAAGADIGTVQVDTFLTQSVVSVPSDEEIHRAATLMKEHSVQRLPVIDDDELQGMLTTSDLTDYLPRLRNTIRRTRHRPDA
ncbi:CBS domain-containing protein [Halovenus sp. HT40]|uniref:CBS domain-containing protein n=1 Tax=Halovenus sp. HT40 TaxID=3126691 RepID=UPI00300F584A